MVALRGNRGPGYVTCSPSQIDTVLYPGSHSVVGVCLNCTGAVLVETCGHSSPLSHVLVLYRCRRHSPPSPFFVGGPGCDWDCVLSLHVAGHPEEFITLLRLMVVASSRLFLVSVEVSLMSVLSMLSPLSTERL